MKNKNRVALPEKGLQSRHIKMPIKATEGFDQSLRASFSEGRTLNILNVIGESWEVSPDLNGLVQVGCTVDSVMQFLNKVGPGDVTIRIDSPGGDMFAGLAIYNVLREHEGTVNVEVIGRAASAASVIAMSGDNVRIAKAGFLMIHNTWTVFSGNRHDFEYMAKHLEPFDEAMAQVYADVTGMDIAKVRELMDNETWISGEDAVSQGFADSLLGSDAPPKKAPAPALAASERKEDAPLKAQAEEKVSLESLLALEAACAALALHI